MLLRSAYKFNPDFYCTVNGLKAIMYSISVFTETDTARKFIQR